MPRRKSNHIQEQTNSKLETNVFNTKGEVIGKISLPKEVFGVDVNPKLLAQAVRVYLANQRLGTHSTKTRGEVVGSTRKIYRQKGTGRARHGDIKAPIFIGGGIAHGPHPRNYSLDFSKKMKRQALFSALADKFQEGRLKIVSGLERIEAKTKMMVEVLRHLNLTQPKEQKADSTLLITPETLKNVFLAGRNLSGLSIREARLLNTYDVLTHRNLLFTAETIPIIQEHFIRKGKILTDVLLEKTTSSKSAAKLTKPKRAKGKTVLDKIAKKETKAKKTKKSKLQIKAGKQAARKITGRKEKQ